MLLDLVIIHSNGLKINNYDGNWPKKPEVDDYANFDFVVSVPSDIKFKKIEGKNKK